MRLISDQEWAARLAARRRLETMLDPAEPLPEATKGQLRPFVGEVGDIRLHQGEASARAAESIGADAFTVGRDVFFGEGQYAPDTTAGQALLAHELTHVRQQSAPDVQRAADLETEARAAESSALSGRAVAFESHQRSYMSADGGELDSSEVARLDALAVRAVGLAERLLTDLAGDEMLRLARADASVEIDLEAPDDAIVEAWAGAIAAAVRGGVS
jgi:hypothetical protein